MGVEGRNIHLKDKSVTLVNEEPRKSQSLSGEAGKTCRSGGESRYLGKVKCKKVLIESRGNNSQTSKKGKVWKGEVHHTVGKSGRLHLGGGGITLNLQQMPQER